MRYILLTWLPRMACLSVVCVLALVTSACPAEEPTSRQRDIDELIAQLGSDNFDVREAAMRRLSKREDAIPALRLARKSKDPEVARRAKELLDLFVHKEKERAFTKFADLAKRGAVDQAVERLVRRGKWDDETECWQVMAELAGKLTDLELKTYGKSSLPSSDEAPARDFRRYAAAHAGQLKFVAAAHPSAEDLKVTLKSRYFVVRAEEIPVGPPPMWGLFTASGSVKGLDLSRSVIFAGGPVSVSTASHSLVVCDGDFTARSGISDCLIIAHGTVRAMDITNSRVISGADVQVKNSKWVVDSKLVEKESNPLGFIKFFDPADEGIKVEAADGGVRVKEAAKSKRFAGAGLRSDDLVTSLDGEVVKGTESFRRLLRAKLALECETVFKVRRGQQVLELRVPMKVQ